MPLANFDTAYFTSYNATIYGTTAYINGFSSASATCLLIMIQLISYEMYLTGENCIELSYNEFIHKY